MSNLWLIVSITFTSILALPGPIRWAEGDNLPLPLDFRREDSSSELWELGEKIVYDPPITNPTEETVWVAGSEETVTWNTSSIPIGYTGTGTLLLGYTDSSSPGENLDVDSPLASGFPLTSGTISFTLPSNLTTRDSYIVVLMGDSGNASPEFTIKSNSASSSVTPTTTTSSHLSPNAPLSNPTTSVTTDSATTIKPASTTVTASSTTLVSGISSSSTPSTASTSSPAAGVSGSTSNSTSPISSTSSGDRRFSLKESKSVLYMLGFMGASLFV